MAAVDAVLSPPVRVPPHSVGFLLTLKEQNNAWWKTNVALEAIALIREAFSDINQNCTEAPTLEPCAIEHAPGALFIAMKSVPAEAKKSDPADIAHRLLEKFKLEPEANKDVGIHLMRVLPVEDSCNLEEVAQIEEMAKSLAAKQLPETASPVRFAVRAEPHSARLPGEHSIGDLVRRVADAVPRVHTVDLAYPNAVVLLILVGDVAMMSIVHDWHELHRFNVHEERKDTAGGTAA